MSTAAIVAEAFLRLGRWAWPPAAARLGSTRPALAGLARALSRRYLGRSLGHPVTILTRARRSIAVRQQAASDLAGTVTIAVKPKGRLFRFHRSADLRQASDRSCSVPRPRTALLRARP